MDPKYFLAKNVPNTLGYDELKTYFTNLHVLIKTMTKVKIYDNMCDVIVETVDSRYVNYLLSIPFLNILNISVQKCPDVGFFLSIFYEQDTKINSFLTEETTSKITIKNLQKINLNKNIEIKSLETQLKILTGDLQIEKIRNECLKSKINRSKHKMHKERKKIIADLQIEKKRNEHLKSKITKHKMPEKRLSREDCLSCSSINHEIELMSQRIFNLRKKYSDEKKNLASKLEVATVRIKNLTKSKFKLIDKLNSIREEFKQTKRFKKTHEIQNIHHDTTYNESDTDILEACKQTLDMLINQLSL